MKVVVLKWYTTDNSLSLWKVLVSFWKKVRSILQVPVLPVYQKIAKE